MRRVQAGAQTTWARIHAFSSMTLDNFSVPEFSHLKVGTVKYLSHEVVVRCM